MQSSSRSVPIGLPTSRAPNADSAKAAYNTTAIYARGSIAPLLDRSVDSQRHVSCFVHGMQRMLDWVLRNRLEILNVWEGGAIENARIYITGRKKKTKRQKNRMPEWNPTHHAPRQHDYAL